jgi:pilus assembly protein CpaB
MDRKALLTSVLATIAGIALLRLYIHRFELEATGGPVTQVLVLARDAPTGTAITRELLGSRGLPQAYLESRHVKATEIDQVLDAKLGVAGRANETLSWSDLASMREPARQLSSLVPEGMRGFTLETRGGAFDGLLAPGDRVDVLLTANRLADERPDSGGVLVAQNVLVLAVGDDLGGTERRRDARPGHASQVTLSVTPPDGLRLAQAERKGELRLIVRNSDDLAITDVTGPVPLTQAQLFESSAKRERN